MPFHKTKGLAPAPTESSDVAAKIAELAQEVEFYGRTNLASLSSRRAGASEALQKLEALTGVPADAIWEAATSMGPAKESGGSKLTSLASSLAMTAMMGEAAFSPGMVGGKTGFGTRVRNSGRALMGKPPVEAPAATRAPTVTAAPPEGAAPPAGMWSKGLPRMAKFAWEHPIITAVGGTAAYKGWQGLKAGNEKLERAMSPDGLSANDREVEVNAAKEAVTNSQNDLQAAVKTSAGVFSDQNTMLAGQRASSAAGLQAQIDMTRELMGQYRASLDNVTKSYGYLKPDVQSIYQAMGVVGVDQATAQRSAEQIMGQAGLMANPIMGQ